jgi:hypothetical protein
VTPQPPSAASHYANSPLQLSQSATNSSSDAPISAQISTQVSSDLSKSTSQEPEQPPVHGVGQGEDKPHGEPASTPAPSVTLTVQSPSLLASPQPSEPHDEPVKRELSRTTSRKPQFVLSTLVVCRAVLHIRGSLHQQWPFEEGEHRTLPRGRFPLNVYENEYSSIIAYTLASSEYAGIYVSIHVHHNLIPRTTLLVHVEDRWDTSSHVFR